MYAHTACAVVIVAARSNHVSPSEGTRAGSALASCIPGRKPPRGGTMDVVGVLAATRHCRRPVVTASVDGMELQKPIRVGERIAMTGSVAFTSARSIGVSVAMRHGPPDEVTPPNSLAGYMTFVALDEEGKALPIPQFQPETPAEVARFREGRIRSEFRKKMLSGQLPDLNVATAARPENPLFIRELLKLLPRSFQLPFDRTAAEGRRHPHLSYVHKIEPIRAGK
ncbi:MAG: hypothetical protein E6J86_18840, partial [Deltaproteobacteria bacterium]